MKFAVVVLLFLVSSGSAFGNFFNGGRRKSNRGWHPFDIFDNFGFDFPNTKIHDLNKIPPGTKKVVRDGNGQGVVFRSRNGNAGGFTFSSGNGAGMAMGSSFGPGSQGDWVMSSSVDGQPGNVVFGGGKPFFGKRRRSRRRNNKNNNSNNNNNNNYMDTFFDTFFRIFNSYNKI